jgi:hypothetical protein
MTSTPVAAPAVAPSALQIVQEVGSFAASKWGHVLFATLAFAAPLAFQAAGMSEPTAVQVVLTLLGSGSLARGYATFLDVTPKKAS